VEHLAQVQKALKDTTARLENAKQNGPLDSNAKSELNQVGQRQQNIEQEAKNLAEKLPSPAFKQALTMAARQAHPATQALNPAHGLGIRASRRRPRRPAPRRLWRPSRRR